MNFKPFDRMWERIETDRDNSDVAYFNSLMYMGEMVTKFTAAGMVAAVNDGRDRQQYRLKWQLVRADGIGDWSRIIDEVLTGVPAQQLLVAAYKEAQELTQRTKSGEWQHDSVELLKKCLKTVEPVSDSGTSKVSGRHWFSTFAPLRNKTRGHRAVPTGRLSAICDDLHLAISLLLDNFSLFQRGWAYLVPTYKRKYNVIRWTESANSLSYLKTRDALTYNFTEGVYIDFDGERKADSIRQVNLIYSDVDATDFYVPNGSFNGRDFEVLSYITNNNRREDAKLYMIPITELPPSETQGLHELHQRGSKGSTVVNLPPTQYGYIARTPPEQSLYNEIVQDNQHRIVTLLGRGGIGKTWLTLEVLKQIANEEVFNAILWFSARDIDLLPDGAKQVRPHILTEGDIANEFARLVGTYLVSYETLNDPKFDTIEFLRTNLAYSDLGRILFVFDNFETVKSPIELYFWIDNYLRLPNKAVITTRFREFKGDYPVELLGMSAEECSKLIDITAKNLQITHLMTPDYVNELYTESGGHPYIVKILLGEVRKAGHTQPVERIIATQDDMLDTLFERTYSRLSLPAQRVFLTLCNWKSHVAQTAIEAVLLRPANEPMDITQAIADLYNSSLIEKMVSNSDDESFLLVPLVAMQFGQRKLRVSRMQLAIQADTELLRYFGATQVTDIQHGFEPRIRRLFREIEQRIRNGKGQIIDYLQIIQFIAKKYPYAWLMLANLYEINDQPDDEEDALKQYLEFSRDNEGKKLVWQQFVRLYSVHSRISDELFAHIQLAQLPNTDFDTISIAVNRFNSLVRQPNLGLDEGEKNEIVKLLIQLMEKRIEEADATDCSRLGWLYMHNGQSEKAMEVAERGLAIDSNNEYCAKLVQNLNGGFKLL